MNEGMVDETDEIARMNVKEYVRKNIEDALLPNPSHS